MRKDNRGFTLVELIVVMAMMAVIVGVSVSLVISMTNWKVNRAVETVDSEMNKAMVAAMSKNDVAGLLVYQYNGTYYATMIKENCYESAGYYNLSSDRIYSEKKLGDSSLTFKFLLKGVGTGSDTTYTLTNQTDKANMSTAAQFLFAKGTGRISTVVIGGNTYNYSGLEISNSRKSRSIVIYPATGKHDVN